LSEALEVAIRDLLMSQKDSDLVAQSLLKRLAIESPSRSERQTFLNFLVHAGYGAEILKLYENWFKEKKHIPLYAFCYVLHRSGFKPGAEFIKNLFVAQSNVLPEDRLTHFLPWEAFDPRLIDIKNSTYNHLQNESSRRKQKHIDKLEYYRVNRMIEEEERLLNELVVMYPEDEQLKKDKSQFRERWARAVIARKAFELFDEGFESTEPLFSADEIKTAQAIVTAIQQIVKKKPQHAYNFAIGLFFLELFEPAREILAYAKSSVSVDWFTIELLLKCRRYVDALDALVTIEGRYAQDPETTFSVTYYRALALEGLGQTGVATELMRSLVNIRPGYRSAHSLLLQWGGRT
jgi:hypothetical protein